MKRVALSKVSPCLYFWFFVMTVPFNPVDSVRCYLCSWSPSSQNFTDKCTRGFFDPKSLQIDCDFGCEIKVFYDRNDHMEMFFRNCVRKGSNVTNDCQKEDLQHVTSETCTCDTNLCNDVMPSAKGSLVSAGATVFLVWMISQ